MGTFNKFLTLFLLCLVVMYGLSAHLSPNHIFDCTLVFGDYVIKVSAFILLMACVGSVLCFRFLAWALCWPSRYLLSKQEEKRYFTSCQIRRCLLLASCEENADASRLLRLLPEEEPSVHLIKAIIADHAGNKQEALDMYKALAQQKGCAAESLAAIRRALFICDNNSKVAEELISCAENLGTSQWITQARFDFYLKNRQWHLALNMVEASLLCRRSRVFTPTDRRIKTLLYCAIANDYEKINSMREANKYWGKAIKNSVDLDILLMHYGFLQRTQQANLVDSLRKLGANHISHWAVARLYLEVWPTIDAKSRQGLLSALDSNHHYVGLIAIYEKFCSGLDVGQELRDFLMLIKEKMASPVSAIADIFCNYCDSAVAGFFQSVVSVECLVMCAECGLTGREMKVECHNCGKLGSSRIIEYPK